MAQVAGPRGPEQHLASDAASAFARAQSPRKHLAVHAPELDVKPHLQIVRRYRRPLLLCLEYADRPTLEDHVHCVSCCEGWWRGYFFFRRDFFAATRFRAGGARSM